MFSILCVSAGISFATTSGTAPASTVDTAPASTTESTSVFAPTPDSDILISKIYEIFPPQLSKIIIDQTTKEEVEEILGKAPEKNDQETSYFYDLSGSKYDTTVSLKDGTVAFIIYKPPAGQYTLEDVSSYIPEEILERASQFEFTTTSRYAHEFGRNFDVLMENLNLRIVVANNFKDSIRGFYMWSDRLE